MATQQKQFLKSFIQTQRFTQNSWVFCCTALKQHDMSHALLPEVSHNVSVEVWLAPSWQNWCDWARFVGCFSALTTTLLWDWDHVHIFISQRFYCQGFGFWDKMTSWVFGGIKVKLPSCFNCKARRWTHHALGLFGVQWYWCTGQNGWNN